MLKAFISNQESIIPFKFISYLKPKSETIAEVTINKEIYSITFDSVEDAELQMENYLTYLKSTEVDDTI